MNLSAKRTSWLVIAVFVLGVGALFSLVSGSESSSAPQQLSADSQSYQATELAEGFPGGDTLPAILVFHSDRGPLSSEQIGALQSVPIQAASAVDGAQAVSPVIPVNDSTAQATLTLPGELSGFGVSDAVKALRTSINDAKAGTLHDMKVIIPLIFLAVLLVLVVVLRALVAPVILLLAAALSTWAAIGTGTFISTHIFGFPGMDLSAPLYSILFLIALGIDYTVFLVLRAQEETHEYGTREGMIRAVGVTGGVITSAGIVLAAVFAALGVLPLITLTQVGILVGFGIVLDTFVVRTLLIPALFAILGDAMWWPRTQ